MESESLRLVTVGLAALLLLGGFSRPAIADDLSVVAVGTWTRNPLATPPPDGGVAVANAVDGPVTVAAVRFSAAGQNVILRLHQADAVAPLGAGIQACVTTSSWQPATNGDMAEAPKDDCASGAVPLGADAAGEWSGDISSLLASSTSIVLLPAPESAAVFSLTFDRPVVELVQPTGTGSGKGGTPSGEPDPVYAPPAESSPDSTFAAPNGFDFTAPPFEVAVPAAPSAPEVLTASPADLPAPVGLAGTPARVGRRGSGRDLAQALRLSLLSLLVGAASVPIWRFRDGEAVPGLSGVVDLWRRRTQGVSA